MLKIVQNWGKIANYPPNAQQRSALLAEMNNYGVAALGLNKKYLILSNKLFLSKYYVMKLISIFSPLFKTPHTTFQYVSSQAAHRHM